MSNNSTINIIAIGDQHFKVDNIPEVDLFIEKITELISNKNPDFVVLLGDLLDTHERLHTTPLNRAYKFIDNVRKLAKTFVLVGNHDMCLGENIQIPMWDGTMKYSQNIKFGDELIGDDGNICKVTSTCTGESQMYLVEQLNGENYTVNENHILSLKCDLHKGVFKNNIIDISIKEYLKFPKNVKDLLYGFKSSGIYWTKKQVLLDPYILGMWLGDKTMINYSFTAMDLRIINKLCKWASDNNLKVIHTGHHNYSIREKEGIESSLYSCKTCKKQYEIYKRAPSIACANSSEIQDILNGNKEIIDILTTGSSKEQLCILNNKELLEKQLELRKYIEMQGPKENIKTSFIDIIKHYDLYNNKYIPLVYIVNDYQTRLELIAGFIDVCGIVNNKEISISQNGKNVNIIDQIEYLAMSLGLICQTSNNTINIKGKNVILSKKISITGNVQIIPSVLYKNELISISTNRSNFFDNLSKITSITPLGLGKYYGFSINNESKRFLLKDFTVTHNCNNSVYLTDNHWLNGIKEWNNVTIVDNVIKENINGRNFIFCPYVSPGRFQEALNTLGENPVKDISIIFAHQEFFGCKMGAFNSIDGDKWDIDFPNVISGHIHINQKPQENIYYPGSSIPVAFGETTKNIIPYITFNDNSIRNYEVEEIELDLPKKKIIYKSIEDVNDIEIPETEDKIKLSISGEYEEFKTFKKTQKYKELVNNGIKVIFKQKRKEIKDKKDSIQLSLEQNTNDFNTIIHDIIENQKDSYLYEAYQLVVNSKEVKNEDILFL